MSKTSINKSLEELKASHKDINRLLTTSPLISSDLTAGEPLANIKKLMGHPNWDFQIEATLAATLEGQPISKQLVAQALLDLDSLLNHPAAHLNPTPAANSTQPLSNENPVTVIVEALMPHGYGLVTTSNPELPENIRYIECFLDSGLIRFDCAHLLSQITAPHLIVNKEKTIRYLSVPLEVVRTKHMFDQEYFWQEPENSNLSVTVKLHLHKNN